MPKISYDSFNALYNSLEGHCARLSEVEGDIVLNRAHTSRDVEKVKNIVKDL